ncbi:beta-1,4-galactosyltransferase 4-like [Clavelina lepadiformis]|uniref:Beta-1,4-galactosyltransferase n=1 Tax=Clavelina lepadiformis TaxID=159417 RepID=A0ABP0F9S5_CLALP
MKVGAVEKSIILNMQPVVIHPSGLEKVRTSEPSCIASLLGNLLKKRVLAIIIIFCLQLPILYYLYTSQVTNYSKNVGVVGISNIRVAVTAVRGEANDCTNNICAFSNSTNLSSSKSDGVLRTSTLSKATDFANTTVKTSSTMHVLSSKPNETSSIKVNSSSSENAKASNTTENKNGNTETEKRKEVAPDRKAEAVQAVSKNAELPLCPLEPPNLQGHLDVSFASEPHTMEQTKESNPLVKIGGAYLPPYCTSRWKVAIIIPFRDRDTHLQYFLQYMHPTLQRQELDYRIYIINQYGPGKFNRAKLMNVGYAESIKDDTFQCFTFHDVDLILENDKAIYSCPERPRHLSVGVDKFKYVLPYTAIFGGVTELTKEQFTKVNGYSNSFWGWGGEDDDMYNRVKLKGMNIMRYPGGISRYRMISHQREKGNEVNPQRFDLIRKTGSTMATDGLSSLKYKVIAREDYPLYTNITVDLFGPAR